MGLWPLKIEYSEGVWLNQFLFPSPDGVMAFKVLYVPLNGVVEISFRPLMGLWPLKTCIWIHAVGSGSFRPLMGLWPLKNIMRNLTKNMLLFPSPDGVMAFKEEDIS